VARGEIHGRAGRSADGRVGHGRRREARWLEVRAASSMATRGAQGEEAEEDPIRRQVPR
jgi:hypothetical protein